MVIKYDKEKLENENIIEYKKELYRLDDKTSQAWILAPYPAVKKLGWDKSTLLLITIREVTEEEIEKMKNGND